MSAADFAFLLAESDPLPEWLLAVLFVVIGGGIGFLIVWALTRHTRRVAHEQASELIEVARREAAVAGEEMKQKVEAEIQEKRAELNREFDRREIESDVRLREIRAHEESLALLDVYGRVARSLLDMADTIGEVKIIRNKVSRQDLAKVVGASREMVSRVMKDLEERGMIETQENGSVILKERLT